MLYRIRYARVGQAAQAEATIEAQNTAEAMVKFLHAHGAFLDADQSRQKVTSICPEAVEEALAADSGPGHWGS